LELEAFPDMYVKDFEKYQNSERKIFHTQFRCKAVLGQKHTTGFLSKLQIKHVQRCYRLTSDTIICEFCKDIALPPKEL
jgi:hypothetical protein